MSSAAVELAANTAGRDADSSVDEGGGGGRASSDVRPGRFPIV